MTELGSAPVIKLVAGVKHTWALEFKVPSPKFKVATATIAKSRFFVSILKMVLEIGLWDKFLFNMLFIKEVRSVGILR